MRAQARGGNDRQRLADTVRRRLDARQRYIRQPLIERTVVPETFLGAADARMPRIHRPSRAAVPLERRAGIESRRPAAPHLVQAPALLRSFVVPRFHKLPVVEERAAIALVVDPLALEHLRPSLPVEF